jgi:hypothetical protein
VAAIVFAVFAVFLALFGIAFTALGLSYERGYWSQRDPSGDPRHDATGLRVVLRHTWHYATGEVRAPLRIAAIGVVMVYLAIVLGVIALLMR